MTDSTLLRLIPFAGLICCGIGVGLGIWCRRFATNGFIALTLVFVSVLLAIGGQLADIKSGGAVFFAAALVLMPIAVLFSFSFFRRGTNRTLAWAVLAGAVVLTLLLLFMLAGLAVWIMEIIRPSA